MKESEVDSMATCSQCGSQLDTGAMFCPGCGVKITQERERPVTTAATSSSGAAETFQKMMDTKDQTTDYTQEDIERNKGITVLSYLGFLVLVPLLAAKESKFARFHSNQGLILLLAGVAFGIAYSILSSVLLAISWRLFFLLRIVQLMWIPFTVLAIIGIFNVVNGKAKELPLIGHFRLIK